MGKQYDPALRKSEHGSRLYETWKRVRRHPHCEEWDNFPTFYTWAIRSGYTVGAWLRLADKSDTYSPDGCEWYIPHEDDEHEDVPDPLAWEDEWNRTVNRIRKYYGMRPLRGTSYDDV